MILWRIVRRVLALFVLVFLSYRHTTIFAVLLLLGGSYVASNQSKLVVPFTNQPLVAQTVATAPAPASRPAASAPVTTRLAPPVETVRAVEDYINGLVKFDAKLMWNALADETVNQMKTRGNSVEELQRSLDEARRRGARYEDVTQIGQFKLADGKQFVFYVVSRRGFAGPDQLDQVYFVFTVDQSGKIVLIE